MSNKAMLQLQLETLGALTSVNVYLAQILARLQMGRSLSEGELLEAGKLAIEHQAGYIDVSVKSGQGLG
jgi:hypothetical protein